MLLSLLETILVTYLMEKNSQEKLGLRDDSEDKQEKVKIDNCSAGESQIKDKSMCSQSFHSITQMI